MSLEGMRAKAKRGEACLDEALAWAEVGIDERCSAPEQREEWAKIDADILGVDLEALREENGRVLG